MGSTIGQIRTGGLSTLFVFMRLNRASVKRNDGFMRQVPVSPTGAGFKC
jgi:hypothetical protein